ncbi:cadherin-5-like [Conger conger]|uniref:cadherin-5-like n=1 Tax=Conger conger TaxID=82655 RepID=UPI002A5A46BD|nr:cadherin-5-like [Conger conger]XP_061101920.1 cadherin-5-like [Conger conger]
MGRAAEGQMTALWTWTWMWAFTLTVATAMADSAATGPALVRQKREWLWKSLYVEEEKASPLPFYVGKLNSTKANKNTVFVIEGEGVNTIFRVDQHGDILAYEKLDREEKSSYILSASLIDINTKQPIEENDVFTIRVLDINDNSPQFPKNYTGSIAERSPKGTEVLKVTATDADDPTTSNGQVAYRLLNGTDLFSINSMGSITTKVNYLDREKQSTYTILVHAKDMPSVVLGNSATTIVTINVGDINDNTASFKEGTFNFDVKENEKPAFKVGVMEVEDQDETQNKDPSFSMKPDACSSMFRLEQNPRRDAVLSLKQGLDFEKTTKYTCEVQMREVNLVTPPDNSGRLENTRATIFIQVLDVDEPPLFTQGVYNFSLREDAAPSSKVGQVSARDPDAAQLKVQYSIDDPNCPVRIDVHTGDMYTDRTLDRELIPIHTFYVTAMEIGSQGLKSHATVNLVVVDVNDNEPELTNATNIFVCHNAAAGMVVQTIGAVDKDEHAQEFYFTLAKESSNFSLINNGNSTASIVVKQGNFEADENREYLLEVVAKDVGHPPRSSTTTLVIRMCRCGPDMSKEGCTAPIIQTGVSISALIAILLCILTILVIVILIVLRRRCQKDNMVVLGKSSGEIHEQLVTYDEEGGGEMDTNGYDVSILTSARNEGGPLQTPGLYAVVKKPPLGPAPDMAGRADMAVMIEVRKDEADHDRDGVPYDTLHIYGYEGAESLASSLSSLVTSSDDSSLDYDFINDWGPRFRTLAELYGVDGADDGYPY